MPINVHDWSDHQGSFGGSRQIEDKKKNQMYMGVPPAGNWFAVLGTC